jgi:antitoxin component YwqK of YwqJK toxin-antitoxin module
MEDFRTVSQEEVLKTGYNFDGERVVYDGEYGQQVCEMCDIRAVPITGLVYELYDNGNIQYYNMYIEGIKNGDDVSFYESGNIKSFGSMYKSTRHGKTICWYENGQIKSEANYKYGFIVDQKEWDENGNLVEDRQDILTDFKRRLIEKYDEAEQKNRI